MQTPSRPTTLLLAIIAVLLAANLIVNLPPQEAKAQSPAAPPFSSDDDVVLVGISAVGDGVLARTLRLWSDGVVEMRIAQRFGGSFAPYQWRPDWPEWVEIE